VVSLGKMLPAALPPGEAERVLAEPSRSGITVALSIRSVAAPLRDGEGRTIAALNVTVHAAETRSRTAADTG
jgi:IclR family pca regulon transcriptional regulator